MQVVEIPLEDLEDFQQNVRRDDVDSLYFDTFVANIKEKGLLNPITVSVNGNGKYKILAGSLRAKAFKTLQEKTIPAIVLDVENDDEGFLISLRENTCRQKMTGRDLCKAIQRCYDLYDGNVNQVAQSVARAPSTVRRYLRISELADDVLARLDIDGPNRLTIDDAYTMACNLNQSESTGSDEETNTQSEESEPKPKRAKSVKSMPWVTDEDGKPMSIPEPLYPSVRSMVRNHLDEE